MIQFTFLDLSFSVSAVRNMNLLDDVLALRHRADCYISFLSDLVAFYCRFYGVSRIAPPACLSLFDQLATKMIQQPIHVFIPLPLAS